MPDSRGTLRYHNKLLPLTGTKRRIQEKNHALTYNMLEFSNHHPAQPNADLLHVLAGVGSRRAIRNGAIFSKPDLRNTVNEQ